MCSERNVQEGTRSAAGPRRGAETPRAGRLLVDTAQQASGLRAHSILPKRKNSHFPSERRSQGGAALGSGTFSLGRAGGSGSTSVTSLL